VAGNGYFDISEGIYVPNSTETWADFDASSSGNDWSGFTVWTGTPNLPLTFTSGVLDYGSSAVVNYLCQVDANYPVDIAVNYGNTVDSSGAIASPATINVTPSQSLSAVKARYFQFTASVDYDDSAGSTGEIPHIASMITSANQELITRTLTDLDTATLPSGGNSYNDAGFRELTGIEGISGITSIITQVQRVARKYVAGATDTDYYAGPQDSTFDLYVEESTFSNASVFVDKEPTPPRLYIYTGSGDITDVVIDAQVTGLPALSSDNRGNIVTT